MIYFLWPIILIIFFIVILIWIYRLTKIYKKRNRRLSFWIQAIILSFLISYTLWFLNLYPFAQKIYIKNRTEELTGKKFWSKKVINFEDPSVRGEGYSMKIFRYTNEIADYFNNPDTTFFTNYPLYSERKWKSTPLDSNEYEILDFVTLSYSNFNKEIISQQKAIREIVMTEGAYYSYSDGKSHNVNFYIIYPKDRLLILIYHNM